MDDPFCRPPNEFDVEVVCPYCGYADNHPLPEDAKVVGCPKVSGGCGKLFAVLVEVTVKVSTSDLNFGPHIK